MRFDRHKQLLLSKQAELAKAAELVREALKRLENGSYGKCIDCGQDIGAARLEAVPWTCYCLSDQERHEAHEESNIHATL